MLKPAVKTDIQQKNATLNVETEKQRGCLSILENEARGFPNTSIETERFF